MKAVSFFIGIIGMGIVSLTCAAPTRAFSGYTPGNLITDARFTATNSLSSASKIQEFLDSKLRTCQAGCLKTYSEGGQSAASIIHNASVAYQVAPEIILSMLETQNRLVTHASPSQGMFDHAMGFPNVTGFATQINAATNFLSTTLSSGGGDVKVGYISMPYSLVEACGSAALFIENAATATIYSYPHLGYAANAAAIAANRGSGDGCSTYGIRNFYIAYNVWFGDLVLYKSVSRFWSDRYMGHFYTADYDEAQRVSDTWPDVWKHEGDKFIVPDTSSCDGYTSVHRFWSDRYMGHFYTADEAEKNRVISTWPDVWKYEGVKYCAGATSSAELSKPVHRFWSDRYMGHFYTADEAEKNRVISTWPDVWKYEGVKFYVK